MTISGSTNDAPVAAFEVQCQDLSCQFDASSPFDRGHIVAYAWSFGDSHSTPGLTVAHSYAKPGTYGVPLTVTDDDGATGSQTQSITVSARQRLYLPDIHISRTDR